MPVLPEEVRERLLAAIASAARQAAAEEAPPGRTAASRQPAADLARTEPGTASQAQPIPLPRRTPPPGNRISTPPERAPNSSGQPSAPPQRTPSGDRPAPPQAWGAAASPPRPPSPDAPTEPFAAVTGPPVDRPPANGRPANGAPSGAPGEPRTPGTGPALGKRALGQPAAGGPTNGRRRPGRGYRLAGVLLVVVALVVAGSLAVAMSRGRAAAGPGTGLRARGAMARARELAADWVAGQVSRTATVSCDPAMCQLLRTHGVPRAELSELGPQTTSPLHSAVVVATPTVRAQFGNLLSSVYAPAVLASFGTGRAHIDVRQIASSGAAAYRAALDADLRSRQISGTELLSSNRIAVSAVARKQLVAGRVDARLLITMAGMAAIHPIYIAGFENFAPGASAGLPLRFADVTQAGHGPHGPGPVRAVTAAFAGSMTAFFRAQHAPFQPDRTQTVRTASGQLVLRIEFAAPSPLGLLGPR